MTEHKFFAVLTFCLLAGGTAAVGSELFGGTARASTTQAQVVTLPMVSIVGARAASPEVVTLPQVMVTARRDAAQVVTLPQVMVTARRDTAQIVTLPQVTVTARRPAPTRVAETEAAQPASGTTGARGPFLRSPGLSHI